jgi:hypothetical protein
MLAVASLYNDVAPPCRFPRLRVLVGGEVLKGAFQAEVASSNHFGADRFSVSAAIDPDPWASAAFWSSQVDLFVEVQFSLDQGVSYTSLIQGLVDLVSLDPTAGTVRFNGRDLSAALIEARTQEAFSNRTSSEIASILAERRGLVPQVVPTSTLVGRYYESTFGTTTLDQFSRSTTEWDLLVYLARCERYDVFVRGTSLYFCPIAGPATVSRILRPCDVTRLMLQRTLTLARDVEVTVKSWNSQKQQAIVECVRSTICTAGTGFSDAQSGYPQRYVLVRPNLSPDTALKLAQQQVEELCQHERIVELEMPGELTLTPGSTVILDGTGTDFDQIYYVDAIERTIQPRAGFIQSVCLKGGSPRSNVVASIDSAT